MADPENEYEFEDDYPADYADDGEPEVLVMGDSTNAKASRSVAGTEKTTASARSSSSSKVPRRERLYQNPLCKPVFQSGNLTIGMSQARLYGLVDENGKLKIPEPADLQVDDVARTLSRIGAMSEPRELNLSHIVDPEAKEETFKPARSKQAENAMRNPRCGYDFIDRLNNQEGGFLERAFGNEKAQNKMEKIQMDAAKEDYTASHDKLACPSCKREQSFDEFWEKKRLCSLCKVRYQKANLCNAGAFERRLKEQEEKRLEKLAKAEAEIYNVKKVVYTKPKTMLPRGVGKDDGADDEDDNDADGDESKDDGAAQDMSNFEAPNNLLKKLAKLNSEKAELLSAAVETAERKKAAREKELSLYAGSNAAAPPKDTNVSASSQGGRKASKGTKASGSSGNRGAAELSTTSNTFIEADSKPAKGKGDKFDLLLGL